MLALRPYQNEALQAVLTAIRTRKNILLQAPTGAGKTVLFSALLETLRVQYPKMRMMVLAHRETLVRQAQDKFLRSWPEAAEQVGIVCASVSKDSDMSKPVLIGSVQTLARRLEELPDVHLLVVDEAHHLAPCNMQSQYTTVINHMRELVPTMRLLGVTATPYRLGHGYIFGDKCKDPKKNWFDELTYAVEVAVLQGQGYLCPLVAKGIERPRLDDVSISSTGDFNMGELGEEMGKDVHLESAVKAWEEHASDRRHTVIFAVTIEHALLLRAVFEHHGHACTIVHSKLPHDENMANLAAFNEGRVPFIVNVGVLTEGWDCPAADCIVLCRPTKSAALYVQMVGRGLRPAEGKEDCLLLDLSGNWQEHGSPTRPRVRWKSGSKEFVGQAPEEFPCPKCTTLLPKGTKICPVCGEVLGDANCFNCGMAVSSRDIKCPSCGQYLKRVRDERVQLIDLPDESKPASGTLVGMPSVNFEFVSKKGNHMVRLCMSVVLDGQTLPVNVTTYFDFDGDGSEFGRRRARQDWIALGGSSPAPSSIAEAEGRWAELTIPTRCRVKNSNGYWNVERWNA